MTPVPPSSSCPPLPAGFALELDPGAKELAPGVWFGGSPARIMRLTDAGQAAWRDLRNGPVASLAAGVLARRLTDAGLAHPRPTATHATSPDAPSPAAEQPADVTVIVPAHDRVGLLDACLAALGRDCEVVVVDDGSKDPAAVAAIADRHGARLIRRDANGGPGAARNTALESATTDLVAFVDSDCVPSPGWIGRLAGHFADPLVAAVAPRVMGVAAGIWPGRYSAACCALDLGPSAARVMPLAAVSYVPTAALLARRTALLTAATDGVVFDEALRTGEDVDLVWRLHEAGWRIRYDPSVEVAHHEPGTWRALLARRFGYGRSAAPLARRHPGAVTHLVLHPWPAATVAAALARRPAAAAVAFGASVITTGVTLRRAGVPGDGLVPAMFGAVRQTWLGVGRYGTQFAAPLLVTAAIAGPGGPRSRRWGRRAAAASLLLGPPLAAWAKGPRTLDPARFALARIADDFAYGLGVWAGCAAARTTAPLRPAVVWHPVRSAGPRAAVVPAGRGAAVVPEAPR